MLQTLWRHAVLWRNLHSWRALYELLKVNLIYTHQKKYSWEGWRRGSYYFSLFFSSLTKMYLHNEGSSLNLCTEKCCYVCALKNAVMFCFKNAIKTRNSTLGFFWSKEWAGLHKIGKGQVRWEDKYLVSIKLFVQILLQYNWILMVTWKWY